MPDRDSLGYRYARWVQTHPAASWVVVALLLALFTVCVALGPPS